MKKRLPIWWILIGLLVAISGWMFLQKGSSIHPLKAFPPYLGEVTVFPINQTAANEYLPPNNRPQAKDFDLLKQATQNWVDTNLSFDSIIYFAFDRNNPGSTSIMMALKVFSEKKDLLSWTSFIPTAQKTTHTYRRTSIVHYEQGASPTYYFTLKNGLLLISSDQRMVERSIALMDEKAPNLYTHLKRQRLWKNNGSLQLFFNTGITTQPQWNQLNWYVSAKSDSLQGADQLEDNNFQRQLAKQQAVDFSTFLSIIPDRINLADMISIKTSRPFFQQKNALGPQFWDPALQEILGDQIAYVIDGQKSREGLSSFFIAPLTDPEKGEELLIQTADRNGLLEDYSYQAYQIRRLLAEEVSTPFWGDRYPDLKNPYWTIIDGFLICTNDSDRLKLWIDYLILQKNITQSEDMEGLFSLLETKAQRMVFWQSSLTLPDQEEDDLWWKKWTEQFPMGAICWNTKGNIWDIKGKLNKQKSQQGIAKIRWRKDFDQPLEYGPFTLTNPLTGELFALVVQDDSHLLNMMNLDGESRWNMELNSRILGEIKTYPINPIEWGILFNTEDAIYKMDAQGGLLTSWPLNTPATQGLQTFIFGEAGDPHFFVPTENNSVYGYTILGDAMMSWNPYPTESTLESPVFHMASSSKDHLFWIDQEGVFQAKYRDGTNKEVQGLPAKIRSLFFSKKNGLTYLLGKEGEVGCLTPELTYRRLLKKEKGVSSFSWVEKNGSVFLLKNDQSRIQRIRLEGNTATREMNISYPAGDYSLGLIKESSASFTLVGDLQKQRLVVLDDQGGRLFSEFIPSDRGFSVFQKEGENYLAVGIGGELVVYGLGE